MMAGRNEGGRDWRRREDMQGQSVVVGTIAVPTACVCGATVHVCADHDCRSLQWPGNSKVNTEK